MHYSNDKWKCIFSDVIVVMQAEDIHIHLILDYLVTRLPPPFLLCELIFFII